ncbi:MAG: DegT/DnrJ/EryC1/StrS family aminotransferase [Phycisphaerales bacterium]|nr:DegT/DnrJ/EryC1/StrS family aminotransferase [Phycisphaerales bacterium]
MPVPPLNLAANFTPLRDEIIAGVTEIMDSGYYVLGPRVEAFEADLAKYCGSPFALGVSSGTDALLVALMALDIGPGDEVICPAFTFFGTAGVIARLGAKPVFCDIDPDTFNVDIADLERRITPKTRALMPVHLYGQLADMDEILSIAKRHKLPVVEDAAQAVGATHNNRMAGAIGDFGCLSFYPTKNLGAIGDAGALLCQTEESFTKARSLRLHGETKKYHHRLIGGNFRIDVLQAFILQVKLRHIDAWTEQRRAVADRYTKLFAEAGLAPELVRLPIARIGRHVYHQYVIRAPRRDELVAFLTERKIGSGVYYPIPLHLQECFAYLGGKAGDLPESERAAKEVLALPMYPELTEAQQISVVAGIRAFYGR